MSWLSKFAAHVYRGNVTPTAPERRLERLGNGATLFAVFVPLLVVAGLMTHDQVASWPKAMAPLPIDRAAWRVIYDAPPDSTASALAETPDLWQSPHRRDDAEHKGRLRTGQGSTFWVGVEISTETLQQAAAMQANHLILGYFSASYQVFIDGLPYKNSRRADQRFPVVIALPMTRLSEARPVKVAIKILHDVGSLHPDALATNRYEGFTTDAGAEAYVAAETIENQTRPALFFGLYLTLGIWAVLIWTVNHKRQEFLYMGVYTLFHSLLQPLNSNLANSFIDVPVARQMFIALIIYEGLVALYMGMSLARVRRSVFTFGRPVLLVAPWIVVAAVSEGPLSTIVSRQIHQWFVPVCYGVAAALCALQAFVLKSSSDRKLRERSWRLGVFSAGLLILGAGYLFEASSYLVLSDYAIGYRLGNFVCVVVFFGLAMRDFRDLDRFARTAPLSKYHRRTPLPEAVQGVLVSLDIKNSEYLLRQDAMTGQAGRSLFVCLSHMWSIISERGGTVLQTDGDALIAFFEDQDGSPSLQKAVQGINAIEVCLGQLSRQFKDSRVVSEKFGTILFRAALVEGAIKPVWQDVNGERFPSWTGVGSTNAFLEAARLIDLERQIDGNASQSAVVVRSPLVAKVEQATGAPLNWLSRDAVLHDKHQTCYRVAAFVPNAVPTKLVA